MFGQIPFTARVRSLRTYRPKFPKVNECAVAWPEICQINLYRQPKINGDIESKRGPGADFPRGSRISLHKGSQKCRMMVQAYCSYVPRTLRYVTIRCSCELSTWGPDGSSWEKSRDLLDALALNTRGPKESWILNGSLGPFFWLQGVQL